MKKIFLSLVLFFSLTSVSAETREVRCASIIGYWPSSTWLKDGEKIKRITANIKYAPDRVMGDVYVHISGEVNKTFSGICLSGGYLGLIEDEPSVDKVELEGEGVIRPDKITMLGNDKDYITHEVILKR